LILIVCVCCCVCLVIILCVCCCFLVIVLILCLRLVSSICVGFECFCCLMCVFYYEMLVVISVVLIFSWDVGLNGMLVGIGRLMIWFVLCSIVL